MCNVDSSHLRLELVTIYYIRTTPSPLVSVCRNTKIFQRGEEVLTNQVSHEMKSNDLLLPGSLCGSLVHHLQ